MHFINLLPWRILQEQQRKKKFLSILLALSLSIIVISIIAHEDLAQKITRQTLQLQQLQNENKTNEQQQLMALKNQQKLKAIEEQIHEMEKLDERRYFLLHLFTLFANQLPVGMYLTALKQQDKTLQIDGYANTHQSITELVTLLNSTSEFYFAQLKFTKELPENNQISFSIQINRSQNLAQRDLIE